MVYFRKNRIILLAIFATISIFLILGSGCNSYVTPPDPDYDYDSYIVSYIIVSPSSATMKVNASKLFTVYAYDSEDNLIPVDPSEVDWLVSYQCLVCGQVWELNPESGSVSTYFTPEKTGKYHIFANYKGKWDNSPVEVE